ncbi:hypothetical protein KKH96_00010 [Patescibacteria group bacterium]|nr:hypothetical protein [Patescibacteria group bacterium]
MPEYKLEWQEKRLVGGVEIVINCARIIIVNRAEKDPDKIAKKEAEGIFEKIPEFSATLKKIIVHFQKEFTKP